MKFIAIILISLFSLSFSINNIKYDIKDDISLALKQGNVPDLVSYFSNKISIKVLEQEDLVSKVQAQAIIQDFFLRNKLKGYQTSHTSIVNGNQQFITGSLDTSNGKFRITILIRENLITQFRIENE